MLPFRKAPKLPTFAAPRSRRWARIVLMTLGLPALVVGVLGMLMAYRIYAGNRDFVERHLPAMPPPRSAQRLLVFSPHPDDETLGAAGLMREAQLHGCDVRVVFFTCGDAFRVGVSRTFHKLTVAPADYRRYGDMRQGESRTALGVLGVPADHIVFLGYPDQGLMPLWTTRWNRLFTSPYTRADHSPYLNAATPRASYTGASVLTDVKRQMLAARPTDIYVTHPSDDHPDHAAASVFVRTALEQLKSAHVPWAQTARLHYYLVHRGDWPVPQGLNEDAPLNPPSQMAALDTHWVRFPLTPYDVKRKYAAIKRYKSQTEMMDRFLFSFARKNELFGSLTDGGAGLAVLPNSHIHLDGNGRDWAGLRPVELDPVGDSVVKAFQASGNITRVYACRDARFLYVRVDMDARLSPQVRYGVTLRPVQPVQPGVAQPASLFFTLYPRAAGHAWPLPGVPGASYAWRGTLLEAAIPLARAGLSRRVPDETLYVSAETRFANIAVDKTGFRAIPCGPFLPALTASR